MKRRAIFFALLVASCHRHEAPPASIDAGIPEGHENGSCGSIADARDHADAGTIGGAAESCLPTKGGAWGIVPHGPAVNPGSPTGAIYSLQVVHAYGMIENRGPIESWRAITKTSTFDFDGNGEAEFVIEGSGLACTQSGDGLCEGPLSHVEVLTYANGDVTPLAVLATLRPPPGLVSVGVFLLSPNKFERVAAAFDFETVADPDQDGRPDFTTRLYYIVNGTDGDVTSYRGAGPRFLAHSLPDGSFSLTDAVAMQALAHECADTPSVDTAGGPELVASAVCARLAGQAPAQIKRRYDAHCASILASNKRLADPARADWIAAILCRSETEGGWSSSVGIPKSLMKMLEETSPLLGKKP